MNPLWQVAGLAVAVLAFFILMAVLTSQVLQ